MRHQITLVGGQLLPVLLGIKEYQPEVVHFLISKETKNSISNLKALIIGTKTSEHECEPYDLNNIKSVCEKIINKLQEEDEVYFNLTGGTKIMLLAAQSIMVEKKIKGFYINQDNTVLEFPDFKKSNITYRVSTEEFFKLSGQRVSSFKKLSDYSQQDFSTSREIEDFSEKGSLYTKLTKTIRDKYEHLPKNGFESGLNGDKVEWETGKVLVTSTGKKSYTFKSQEVLNLFFDGGWWELLVAQAISGWAEADEILLKIEFPFKSDLSISKNEIDLVINRNNKLIFIECKSGKVIQQDINKMKAIKDTYGGVASKSILVSRYPITATLMEKCKELNVEVFSLKLFKNHPGTFTTLIKDLKYLEKKISL